MEDLVADPHPALAVEPGLAAHELDAAFVQPRQLDGVVEVVDDLVTAGEYARRVERRLRQADTGHAFHLVHQLARPQQRLRRHAGVVRALAADQLALDQRHLQPVFGHPPGADLAGRAGPDHDGVDGALGAHGMAGTVTARAERGRVTIVATKGGAVVESTQVFYPSFRYRDARAAIDWLVEALGFEAGMVVDGEGDRDVAHAELTLGSGMIMLGSESSSAAKWGPHVGQGWVYVAVDDPDALYERAKAAGAEVVMEPTDTDYGSRDFAIRDPEGNLWNFGTYRP